MKIRPAILLLTLSAAALAADGADTAPPIVRGFNVSLPADLNERSAAEVIPVVKEWGAQVVRIQLNPVAAARAAFGQDGYTQENIDELWPKCLDTAEAAIKEAEKAGLKVVLDLHSAPFAGNRSAVSTWKNPKFEESLTKAWAEMARRFLPYSQRGVIWGYDIYNEPVVMKVEGEPVSVNDYRIGDAHGSGEPIQWIGIATNIIAKIREVDPDVWIVFETGIWNSPQSYRDLTPLADKRVIYSVHTYDPHSFTHQGVGTTLDTPLTEIAARTNITYPGEISGELWDKARMAKGFRRVREFQLKHGVPIYVGEFSVVRWAPGDSATAWLKDTLDLFQEYGWSWTYHAFREWHGWSVEHDEEFWKPGMPNPQRLGEDTARATLLKTGFKSP